MTHKRIWFASFPLAGSFQLGWLILEPTEPLSWPVYIIVIFIRVFVVSANHYHCVISRPKERLHPVIYHLHRAVISVNRDFPHNHTLGGCWPDGFMLSRLTSSVASAAIIGFSLYAS